MLRLAALLVLTLTPLAHADSPFAFRESGPTTLELTDGGRPVYVYNFGPTLAKGFPETMRRSAYLHPVYAPNGAVLTDDFNPDHPHHRGISWMWPEVTVDGRKGDMWQLALFDRRMVAWKARETGDKTARLALENGWFDGQKKFVREEVEIIAHSVADARRLLEFTLRFEAVDRPVEITGISKGKKGFGGFCFRFAPRDGGTTKTVITTDRGVAKKDEVLGRHPWAELNGMFQGKAAGARVEDTDANPGYPKNGWLLRHGFGFLNVSYPGIEKITLEPGKPLVLKYRVILMGAEK